MIQEIGKWGQVHIKVEEQCPIFIRGNLGGGVAVKNGLEFILSQEATDHLNDGGSISIEFNKAGTLFLAKIVGKGKNKPGEDTNV